MNDVFLRVILKFYYQHCNELLPNYLQSFNFILDTPRHHHGTRFKSKIIDDTSNKVYTAACLRIALIKILKYTHKNPNSNISTDIYQLTTDKDKLLNKPKQLYNLILEKTQTHSLHGFNLYTKVKFIELYSFTCTKLNCPSCGS